MKFPPKKKPCGGGINKGLYDTEEKHWVAAPGFFKRLGVFLSINLGGAFLPSKLLHFQKPDTCKLLSPPQWCLWEGTNRLSEVNAVIMDDPVVLCASFS